ncbi:hypothetical protein O6H91_Y173100 [Diphasiastrum complanatum]|nr:hypothetical protein O6H91_Y173100 [Diphasiastrum complanatum]
MCPQIESLNQQTVQQTYKIDRTVSVVLLRLFFHDYLVLVRLETTLFPYNELFACLLCECRDQAVGTALIEDLQLDLHP